MCWQGFEILMSEKGNLQFHCSLEQHKGNHSPLITIPDTKQAAAL